MFGGLWFIPDRESVLCVGDDARPGYPLTRPRPIAADIRPYPRPGAGVSAPDHLHALESEAVHIFREVAAELERPVLLFSGDNFPEVLEYIERRVGELGERLISARVEDSIKAGRAREEWDPGKPGTSRNRLQTVTLLDAIEHGRFDAAFGGARR